MEITLRIVLASESAPGNRPGDSRLLAAIVELAGEILKGDAMAKKALEHLAASVKAATDVQQSVILLLSGLTERIRATAGDQNKVDALAGELDVSIQGLTAAVVANTPAEPDDTNATAPATPPATPTPGEPATPPATPVDTSTPATPLPTPTETAGTTTAPAPAAPATPADGGGTDRLADDGGKTAFDE